MYEQVEKPKENQSRAVANTVAQNKSGNASTFQFVNNRPESIVQKKMQTLTNYSSSQPIPKKENNTGIANKLIVGIENNFIPTSVTQLVRGLKVGAPCIYNDTLVKYLGPSRGKGQAMIQQGKRNNKYVPENALSNDPTKIESLRQAEKDRKAEVTNAREEAHVKKQDESAAHEQKMKEDPRYAWGIEVGKALQHLTE
nr:hypothetical protein [uncultured Desulfobacter sp.]